jgi:hypothetical protein
MRQNWEEMPDFVNFSNKLKSVQTFHRVWFPRKYALFNLSFIELEKIHLHLSSFDFSTETYLEKLNRDHYKYFQNSVKEWLNESIDIGNKTMNLQNPQVADLKSILFERIKLFLFENNNNLDENSESNYQKIIERINQLSDLLIEDDLKKNALLEMCRVDVKEVVDAFTKNDVNEILVKLRSIL